MGEFSQWDHNRKYRRIPIEDMIRELQTQQAGEGRFVWPNPVTGNLMVDSADGRVLGWVEPDTQEFEPYPFEQPPLFQ